MLKQKENQFMKKIITNIIINVLSVDTINNYSIIIIRKIWTALFIIVSSKFLRQKIFQCLPGKLTRRIVS